MTKLEMVDVESTVVKDLKKSKNKKKLKNQKKSNEIEVAQNSLSVNKNDENKKSKNKKKLKKQKKSNENKVAQNTLSVNENDENKKSKKKKKLKKQIQSNGNEVTQNTLSVNKNDENKNDETTNENKQQENKGLKRKQLPDTELPEPDSGAFEAMLIKPKNKNSTESSKKKAEFNIDGSEDLIDTSGIPKKKRKMKRALPVVPELQLDKYQADSTGIEETSSNIQVEGNEESSDNRSKKLKQNRKKKEKKDKNKPKVEAEHKKSTKNISAIQYLETWKNNRQNWTFKKVHQTWLLQHLYDNETVSDESFSILLEYLQGAKGAAKTKTIEKAETYFADDADSSKVSEITLQRARDVVQHLSE